MRAKTLTCIGSAALGAAALALAGHAQENAPDSETMIDQTFPVGPGGRLEIAVGDADVDVVTGDYEAIQVEVILSARSIDQEDRDYFEQQNFAVVQSGDSVEINTNRRGMFSFNITQAWDAPRIIVRVHAPTQTDAAIRTSDGDIRLGALEGDLQARSSDGDIQLSSVTGGALSLLSSDGDIDATVLSGDEIAVRTSDGDLTIGSVTADSLSARTSDGDIAIETVDAQSALRTSDGDIDVDQAGGSEFFAHSSDGTITINALTAPNSRLTTSDGNITVGRVDGALNARTSDGDITVSLPRTAGAELYLRGDRVRLEGEFSLEGDIERERIEGLLNGGGPTLRLRASDGRVTVSAQ